MKHIINKTIENGKYIYTYNGEVYRKSKNDYKYGCIATCRASKGATKESDGKSQVIALGNIQTSTLKSNAMRYHYCDLEVVEIQ